MPIIYPSFGSTTKLQHIQADQADGDRETWRAGEADGVCELSAPFCAHCDSREGGFVELHIKRFPQQFICDARFRIGEFFGNLLNFGDHPWIQFVGLANSIDWWSSGARSAPAMS